MSLALRLTEEHRRFQLLEQYKEILGITDEQEAVNNFGRTYRQLLQEVEGRDYFPFPVETPKNISKIRERFKRFVPPS